MIRILAIDPGERWTGFAILDLKNPEKIAPQKDIWSAASGVLDAGEDIYKVTDLLRQLLTVETHLAIEDYAVRPVGHQSWTRAMAVRLIGSIEYEARRVEPKTPVFFYPPGNALEDIRKLGFATPIQEWSQRWWLPKKSEWEHALSAWRILGFHLLNEFPWALQRIVSDNIEITHKPHHPGRHLESRTLWRFV